MGNIKAFTDLRALPVHWKVLWHMQQSKPRAAHKPMSEVNSECIFDLVLVWQSTRINYELVSFRKLNLDILHQVQQEHTCAFFLNYIVDPVTIRFGHTYAVMDEPWLG